MTKGLENSSAEIIYHFDLPAHSLPLKQFIDTASASQSILNDFKDKIFDNKLKYELHVLPTEKGGFIEILSIVVIGGNILWDILKTDIGKAYIKGLTGKEPAQWIKELGEKQREWLNKRKKNEVKKNTEITSTPEPFEGKTDISCKVNATALVILLVSFLKAANKDKLQQAGITPEKFPNAFKAKNAIYTACINNPDVKGLGFNRSHDFPIKRSDFPDLITQMPDQVDAKSDMPTSWAVEIVDIVVNSPNWKRDGRKWQAFTKKHQDIAFKIEDDSFWHRVQINDIQPVINDDLRVQWAYPAGLSKPSKKIRVLRVLSYNGTKISDQMSQAELDRELKEATSIEPEAPGLFGDINDHRKSKKNEGED